MILSLVALLMMLCTASAQRLVSVKNYGANWDHSLISMKNKPNGTIYRLRKEIQNEYLPRVEEAKGLEMYISERIDIGFMAMYRLPAGDQNYKFIVVIYDKDEHPLYTVNLGEVANNDYCEVQDVRWDADSHNLLFNMACPSYASGVNGKGSKLHCYNPERRQMVWSTDWLTSNDIFILDSQFVFCSYGFTGEKKFLFMLDKQTGKVLSKLPFTYKVEYLELKSEQNGREYLYAVDYNDNLYKFQVQGAKTVAENGTVFTVCYAVSDDGFLNVRSEPSMKGKIIGKLLAQDHGLGRGILIEKGPTWSKVAVDEVEGWVYTKYLGQMTWMAGTGPKLVAKDVIAIWCENNATGGLDVFCSVDKGTVIADTYFEHDFGDGVKYYELRTGHDYLFVKKSDVIVK